MSLSRTHLPWIVPVSIAGVIAGAIAIPGVAAGRSSLPPKSAAALIADLHSPLPEAYSGVVEVRTQLGLPALPSAPGSATSPQALLAGTHEIRIAVDGVERQRAGLIGELSEYEVVHNGRDVWTYNSSTRELTHQRLGAKDPGQGSRTARPAETSPAGGDLAGLTPTQAAQRAVDAITPSTKVWVDTAVSVAGRDAYQLVLEPRDAHSLVGAVRIAVDGKTHMPLRVQVIAAHQSAPAISIGFRSLDLTRPARSQFSFHAPAGAHLTSLGSSATGGTRTRHHARSDAPATSPTRAAAPETTAPSTGAAKPGVQVVGKDWTSVLVATNLTLTQSQREQVTKLSARIPEGYLLHTALVNIILADNGRVYVGSVDLATLRSAEAAPLAPANAEKSGNDTGGQ